MTRIVAGTHGGRTLAVPPKGTRPTSGRTREAIFSRLEHYGVLAEAWVLDLYAGSGALGLEAASRGARHVTLVDSARVAVDVARRNVAALGLDAVVQVEAADATRYAAGLATPQHAALGLTSSLDLVFLDPPYDLDEAALAAVLGHLTAPGVLDEQAIVVVERSTRSPEPTWPPGLALIARKDYGETAVYYLEPHAETGSVQP
ncbi:MAG: 16S rRNA (guanine(966)-N(2))-methyltransferase RsmD [Promicromonosporaceae bacterium]|nr:16S rRNA (guanine(966)-N(2))-methyltransferase RsmD [Promicromonosporaceae bacterium]